MSSAVSTTVKPQLRGLLQSKIKRNLIVAMGLSVVSGVLFKIFVSDARKNQYAEFYKNYDAEEEFKRMKNLGLFQSG
ncbi:cytochrome c oxidase subunit 6C-like [Rhodnius prolixus]|uniref:Putative cytochrome c oxidase n=2 Tax=Rhodnius TaxID=13248 RepID=R4FPA5_RHOPR